MPVDVYGVRHHGPGSARAVRAALEEQPPDLVLIEGCPELDAIVDLLGEADMVPPVAGLVYAVEEPRQATFYPLAHFSPEWVAARWALARGVPVRFLDLPAAHAFALAQEEAAAPEPADGRRRGRRSTRPAGPGRAPRPDRHAGRDRRLRRRRALVGGRRRAAARLARRALRRDPRGDGRGPLRRHPTRRRPRRAQQRAPRAVDAPGAAGRDQGGARGPDRGGVRRLARAGARAGRLPAGHPRHRPDHQAAEDQGRGGLDAVDGGPAQLRLAATAPASARRGGTSTSSTT